MKGVKRIICYLPLLIARATLCLLVVAAAGCATVISTPCPGGAEFSPNCIPAEAVNDASITQLYDLRSWKTRKQLKAQPELMDYDRSIAINKGLAKVIGPSYEESVTSLALKLWMIESAHHTIDLAYYIFAKDMVGYAVLGALCNAVQRGVDVRILVDSVGSLRPLHNELKALQTCAEDGGFIRNASGQVTTKKARVQAGVINAVSKLQFNRRSHDKLLIVDGTFSDKAMVLTGGRNISLDYYGIYEDGSVDPTAFQDVEVFVRDLPDARNGVGATTEHYFTQLFLHRGNKMLSPSFFALGYGRERKNAQEALAFFKRHADVGPKIAGMAEFLARGMVYADLRLAHQLGNLSRENAVQEHIEYLRNSPNAIGHLIAELVSGFLQEGELTGTLRIVSPYLFLSKYPNAESDGANAFDMVLILHKLLEENPGLKVEMITNSVMTSDNALTQAFIDIDVIPRLYLGTELQERWKALDEKEDDITDIYQSPEWQAMLSHPRLVVYQTGGHDSTLLGGDAFYGKLHAKFIRGSTVGFIGTSNFDYRSNVYNNEAGFFYHSEALSQQLDAVYEGLRQNSYRWGTKAWLDMRRRLMGADSTKAFYVERQRAIYKILEIFGLEYLI